jgi:hypothetical protein
MSEAKTGNEAGRKSLAKIPLMMLANYIHPLNLLKETIDNKDWFKGLILSTTFFELFGSMMLHSFFRQEQKGSEQHKIVTDFLDRLGLMKLIRLLYLCGFIKLGTYRRMKKIVKERNKWIHRVQRTKRDFAYLLDVEQEDIEKIINLITDAIDCLKELGIRD